MNERIKELWSKSAEATKNDSWDEQVAFMQRFADLIRADEREAIEQEDWTVILREGSLVTWADAEELGDRIRAVIRARGNT